MSRQRVRLLHILRALHRSWNHVPGRSRRAPLRFARHARGVDRHRLRHRPAVNAAGRRNSRPRLTAVAPLEVALKIARKPVDALGPARLKKRHERPNWKGGASVYPEILAVPGLKGPAVKPPKKRGALA